MTRFTIASISLIALAILGASQAGVFAGEGSDPESASAVDLMVVNNGSGTSWLEVGWSHDADQGIIAGQQECGWVSSGMTSFRGKEIPCEGGACYLLLYDEPGGVLLDVSRPFYRTDTDRLFVDAIVSRGTMTIDAY